jgi:hypothetical protein
LWSKSISEENIVWICMEGFKWFIT